MALKIKGVAVTHVGKVRRNNEDNYNLFGNYRDDVQIKRQRVEKTVLAEQMLAAVYDGMGGEEAGETASLIAARALMPCRLEQAKQEVNRQIQDANEQICMEMKRRRISRMGTTLAALYIDQDTAVSCNVGDSRCYFMRDGKLRQLSVDHSEAQRMIDMGVLDGGKARESKGWHKLTQHLGIHKEEFVIEPYFSAPVKIEPGDLFMLCSDGLTDLVMDDEIANVLCREMETGEKADALVQLALDKGGRDNTTVIVMQAEQSVQNTKKGVSKFAWCALALLLIVLLEGMAIINYARINKALREEQWDQEAVYDEDGDKER